LIVCNVFDTIAFKATYSATNLCSFIATIRVANVPTIWLPINAAIWLTNQKPNYASNYATNSTACSRSIVAAN
jgi:hypothetical protein